MTVPGQHARSSVSMARVQEDMRVQICNMWSSKACRVVCVLIMFIITVNMGIWGLVERKGYFQFIYNNNYYTVMVKGMFYNFSVPLTSLEEVLHIYFLSSHSSPAWPVLQVLHSLPP